MNLKKGVKIFVILLLFFFVLFFLKTIIYKKDKNRELASALSKVEDIQNNTNNNELKEFLVINEKKDTLSISELLDTKKLIYRFSPLNCDICVINEFKNLDKMMRTKMLEKTKLIILSNYQNPRDLYVFKRLNNLEDYEIYNLISTYLGGFELEKMNIPYFFTLDKELKMSHTFIPLKEENSRTNEYLLKVIK